LTRYSRNGASSRLRFLQYQAGLTASGIDLEVAPFFDSDYLRDRYAGRSPPLSRLVRYYARRVGRLAGAVAYDALWVEKEALPWVPAVIELRLFRDVPLIVDFDDAWHLRYGEASSPFAQLMLRQKLEAIARRADVVIVGNSFLERWAHTAGARQVVRIPTVLDLSRYAATPLPARGPFTIGWIGTPATVHYLETIRGALTRLLACADTRLLLIGVDRFTLAGPRVETRAWSEDTEDPLLRQMHVGVMPLHDGVWERGKSGCKLLQYMAAARPVVASPVGTALGVVEPGVNGAFANTEDDWVRTLSLLRGDRAATAAMGAAARRSVERAYSLELALPLLRDVLRSATRARAR
jgi:glycosyltransferase involved in cell wall biosynthesis